ncbi:MULTISPECIES: hypothetical protein [unclassified Sphingopyxis]|uniref:hypothetical protein n=1 Tax=unclassified Sphingopyxis TaxID=2614943 RepID=UPI0007312AE3|nr:MULTISPECIES: hypothetical protein [unclassified Sphingopyxis]KTE23787.1 hypothetical protein ATE61_16395 [Sphingopyxis sp. H057]KTE50255.1 hypothetical protein ATE64_17610 [Sphingopyxis sp. H073]KTE50641.1 hypothetical protein ATE69_18085 [Sphingopyxis sp. H071]KTE59930.1 hypothetical protein ATE66_10110 [Sphingopyxis sp. H107]KTE63710.1 hypothetical protein ATE65_14790 [Sphingopyxis sp. H100]
MFSKQENCKRNPKDWGQIHIDIPLDSARTQESVVGERIRLQELFATEIDRFTLHILFGAIDRGQQVFL